jgi:hypothetical protein
MVIQDIASPAASTTELRQAIEAMAGWQSMMKRYSTK